MCVCIGGCCSRSVCIRLGGRVGPPLSAHFCRYNPFTFSATARPQQPISSSFHLSLAVENDHCIAETTALGHKVKKIQINTTFGGWGCLRRRTRAQVCWWSNKDRLFWRCFARMLEKHVSALHASASLLGHFNDIKCQLLSWSSWIWRTK